MMRLSICILILCCYCAASAQSFKVMTYNIRFDNPQDSANAWPNRKQKVTNLLSQYAPDVLGVQEALLHQLNDITAALPYYHVVGVGRDDGKQKGEYSAVLFRKERFDLLEQNTFWLSETPKKPGSKSWDAAITRVVTWAILSDKQSNRTFAVLNTHFDHMGAEARKQSAQLLKSQAREIGSEIPVIITGDFNCTREEEPYQVMVDGELLELVDPSTTNDGTYCTFKVNSIPCEPIDYIFLTSEWRADRYTVIKDHDGTYYPSDHLPVMVTVSLSE